MAVAVVVAAGESRRMGSVGDKRFAALGDRPVLAHALGAFERCKSVERVVLVCAADATDRAAELASEYGLTKVEDVVAGGAIRQESVTNGMKHVRAGEVVVVHDGARPLVTPELIERAIEALSGWDGVVVAVPATDTVKQVEPNDSVSATLDRNRVWLAQTPQVFAAGVLEEALEAASARGVHATDDAALVERLGKRVRVVQGSIDNIKVTVPADIDRAERILQARSGQ